MTKYALGLLIALSLVLTGCTSTAPTSTTDQGLNTATTTDQKPAIKDGKPLVGITFSAYQNPAIGYTVNIPATWHWRHFHKGELGADAMVDDYLMISPTHSIDNLGTESPAEIIIEVSKRPLSDFVNTSLTEISVTIGGQDGVLAKGIINNEVFSNFQQIEYRFSKDNKTYRLVYLADSGLTNNEAVFEEIIKSFQFVK